MGNADTGGGSAYVEAGGTWEIAIPSSQFCFKPKMALKDKVLKNRVPQFLDVIVHTNMQPISYTWLYIFKRGKKINYIYVAYLFQALFLF